MYSILDWTQDLLIQSPNKQYNILIEFPQFIKTKTLFVNNKEYKVNQSVFEKIIQWQEFKKMVQVQMCQEIDQKIIYKAIQACQNATNVIASELGTELIAKGI